MVGAVRTAVTAATPGAFIEAFPLWDVLEPYTKPWRLGRAVFVVFGVLSTIIATIGLYGVIAFGVQQRRRELGIRFALGASRSTVVKLVVGGAAGRLVIGALVGVAGALVLGRQLGALLFQTSPTEGSVLAGSLAIVAVASLVACVVPAWRAVRVDPTVSLRVD
jgi:ABC-type antimicrobial peptide transport system permease subunit